MRKDALKVAAILFAAIHWLAATPARLGAG